MFVEREDYVFRLPEAFAQVQPLCQHLQRLSNVIFDKINHGRFRLFLDDLEIVIRQGECFHVVDTLDGEHSASEMGLVDACVALCYLPLWKIFKIFEQH